MCGRQRLSAGHVGYSEAIRQLQVRREHDEVSVSLISGGCTGACLERYENSPAKSEIEGLKENIQNMAREKRGCRV